MLPDALGADAEALAVKVRAKYLEWTGRPEAQRRDAGVGRDAD
jgi:hypothetical protein